MSVFSRFFRRLALAAVLLALLCGLSGCSELGSQLQEGGVYLRDLFMNSIARFPEGSSQAAEDPQDAMLSAEFVIQPPEISQVVGTVTEDVNIRSGPNAEYDHLGSYLKDSQVQIYHQVLVGESPWGLTESGWISMNYVRLDDPSKAVTTPLTGKDCLIVIPSLDVRSGPGWQYPSIGLQMEAYTSRTVLAQSGPWYLLAEGWVNKDGVYLEGTEGARTGTVTGTEVNVRSGPGTQYDVLDVVVRGDTLTVFHQVSVNDKYWGYTSIGWISMSYVKLEELDSGIEGEPEDPETQPREGILDSAILGQWQAATVSGDGASLVFGGNWLFNIDGTFQYTGSDTRYYAGTGAVANSAAADDTQEFSGMFTYDGSTLTLFCTADPAMSEEELPYILLVSATIDSGVMVMTSGDSSVNLYAGTQDTVASQLLGH